MKTTVKRTLSLLLAAASMASVLTACGSKDTAAADTSADTQAASASADASDLGPVLTRIKESGEMVIATASGYMPYEFVDISSANQDVIGVDMALGDKIIEKLSDKLGVEVKKKVEDTTFTANLAAVAADQVDIMLAGMSPTEERKQNMDFSDVYLKAEQRIMVRKADADSYKDIDSFNGKTIAVQKNTTQEKIAQGSMPGVRQLPAHFVRVALHETAGDDQTLHAAGLLVLRGLEDGLDGFGLCRFDEAAGVDHADVRLAHILRDLPARVAHQGEHMLAVHQIFGAAERNKS